LDPLIKSHHNIFDVAKHFSQLPAKRAVADQKVASKFPTVRFGLPSFKMLSGWPDRGRSLVALAVLSSTEITMDNDLGLVCAWCDVWNRVERVLKDESGHEFLRDSSCAYCGRTELRFGKLGRQTPIPTPRVPPDGLPF
jgi:hypothetical protein